MNTFQLSSSRQVLVAVAAFVGLAFAVILWGAVYLVAMHNLQTEFETKSQTLNLLKRQTLPRLSGGGNGVQQAVGEAVISAPTETVAASELHKSVLAALERAGGAVHSIQAEATTDVAGEGLRRLNAQIAFDGSIGALQKVLFDLETAIPFIFIDSLLVQPTTTSGPATKPGEALRVTLVASSYWKNLVAGSNSH